MVQITGPLTRYPARVSFFSYLGLIAVGAAVLSQPFCSRQADEPISILDAAFTSTSAACVTGLAVRSTEFDFSFIGQLVILLLIQIGGIGIMTITTYVLFHLGSRESLRHRLTMAEAIGADDNVDLRTILGRVLMLTLTFEGAGFVLLFFRNLFDRPILEAAWHALFHSVSAFCNAGFSLNDDSLVGYRDDWFTCGVISILVIVGGIGFPVIIDLQRNWHGKWVDRWDRLHLHSKLTLIGTVVFLLLGMISFLALEWNGVLKDVSWYNWPLVAFFHSMTLRTAGFNTVDLTKLNNATLFVSIVFMLVGGSPGSTAGGLKTTTATLLALRAWSTFRGYTQVNLFRRTIPRDVTERAVATTMLFIVVAAIALTVLLVADQRTISSTPSERRRFMSALFEVASALGTVGLSMNYTSFLSPVGRMVVIALMFLGRLGPISVFAALSRTERDQKVQFASQEPMIG